MTSVASSSTSSTSGTARPARSATSTRLLCHHYRRNRRPRSASVGGFGGWPWRWRIQNAPTIYAPLPGKAAVPFHSTCEGSLRAITASTKRSTTERTALAVRTSALPRRTPAALICSFTCDSVWAAYVAPKIIDSTEIVESWARQSRWKRRQRRQRRQRRLRRLRGRKWWRGNRRRHRSCSSYRRRRGNTRSRREGTGRGCGSRLG